MTIDELFRTVPAGLNEVVVPDCGHSAAHIDLAPGHVWTCFHADHTVNGRAGLPVPLFAAQEF